MSTGDKATVIVVVGVLLGALQGIGVVQLAFSLTDLVHQPPLLKLVASMLPVGIVHVNGKLLGHAVVWFAQRRGWLK